MRIAEFAIVCILLLAVIFPVVLLQNIRLEVGAGAEKFLHCWPGFHGRACGIHKFVQHPLPLDGKAVYSVLRTSQPSVGSRRRASLPQTIWQTARSHVDTPPLAIDFFNSWTAHNPGYDHFFLDDEEIQEMVGSLYNESVADAFKNLPLGVMRADAAR